MKVALELGAAVAMRESFEACDILAGESSTRCQRLSRSRPLAIWARRHDPGLADTRTGITVDLA